MLHFYSFVLTLKVIPIDLYAMHTQIMIAPIKRCL